MRAHGVSAATGAFGDSPRVSRGLSVHLVASAERLEAVIYRS